MGVGGSNRRGGSSRPSRAKGGGASGGLNGHAAPAKLAFTIPSDYQRGNEVQARILEAAREAGFAGEHFFGLRIALEEALVNAIKHGNGLDLNKKVHIAAKITPRRIEVVVEDEGPGFHRGAVPDPTHEDNLTKTSGRGILLIEAYMSSVKWDRGGRRLRMVREKK